MSVAVLYAVTGLGLFSLGLYALIVRAHLLRKILALNIMGSGVFLVLTALARRAPDGPPDPVPHAMVITGIVVAVAATALALVLLRRVVETTGQPRLPDPDSE
ncbi:NADH-quinone oxidoreductase subunit K [Thiohalophilus thiocyanatoxydans]|uniref:Multisubunit sodium/proton antiporter MrpC subunit n=1 Tax=Thiohalophilus thiocyanatoxydans TaxID=381308 RepID=A0A4V3H4C0_9GAMM|nr:NADH-quinone oxidoreductase subunit K [Thiohalophilus thiocyanatoxydans]TDY02605.1 multisubunit sodium/proton antiporter MrpC subunit [Thiohalophilus thiocyanatoxydans]